MSMQQNFMQLDMTSADDTSNHPWPANACQVGSK